MKLKIIELEKGKIRLSLEGEGHTFMNALTEEIGSKKDPVTVIREACDRISTRCDDLLGCLKN